MDRNCNLGVCTAKWLALAVTFAAWPAFAADVDLKLKEEVGGTVMPFGGSAFGGDADKVAERMRVVKERGRISRFVMSGIGSSVRVNGIKGPEAYTALGRHIAAVQGKVASDGIKIGFFMSPTLNCGINHPWAKFRNRRHETDPPGFSGM